MSDSQFARTCRRLHSRELALQPDEFSAFAADRIGPHETSLIVFGMRANVVDQRVEVQATPSNR